MQLDFKLMQDKDHGIMKTVAKNHKLESKIEISKMKHREFTQE